MATPSELEDEGKLFLYEVDLEAGDAMVRNVYFLPRAKEQFLADIPLVEPDPLFPDEHPPDVQADAMLYNFITARDLYDFPPHPMRPIEAGMWELRTNDLRFVGWFWSKRDFIVSSVFATSRIKKGEINYDGLREEAKYRRASMGLDEPLFFEGGIDEIFA